MLNRKEMLLNASLFSSLTGRCILRASPPFIIKERACRSTSGRAAERWEISVKGTAGGGGGKRTREDGCRLGVDAEVKGWRQKSSSTQFWVLFFFLIKI